MKLPKFDYASPATVAEAVALLAGHDTAKIISGGQSLMPVLAFRMAYPSLLIDLRRIPDLDRIDISETCLTIGARVRWCDIEDDHRLTTAHPLLAAAIPHVAHHQIRKRGTVGGSLCHADPAAEMPGLAVACDATLTLAGPSGVRTVNAADFFLGPLTTALASDEILTHVTLPAWPASRRWGFQEFSRRRGDFAIAGVAAFYDPDGHGLAGNAHIGVIGVNDRPRRLPQAEAALNGTAADAEAITATAAGAAAEVDPPEDIHGTARYRRALLATLIERALTIAATA
jgi:carbon-monoxide dehydrogenase medium subunit